MTETDGNILTTERAAYCDLLAARDEERQFKQLEETLFEAFRSATRAVSNARRREKAAFDVWSAASKTGLDLIPEHCRDGMRLYIESGIRPDKFLASVLTNNLFAAHTLADDINRNRIDDYITFLAQHAPPNCFGSRVKMEAWIEDAIERRKLEPTL